HETANERRSRRGPRAPAEPERVSRQGEGGRNSRSDRTRAWRGVVHAASRADHGARAARRGRTGDGRLRRSPGPGTAPRQATPSPRESGSRRAPAERAVRDHVYLDSSALVKLVVLQPESRALRQFLSTRALRISSALAEVEVPRALLRAGYGAP